MKRTNSSGSATGICAAITSHGAVSLNAPANRKTAASSAWAAQSAALAFREYPTVPRLTEIATAIVVTPSRSAFSRSVRIGLYSHVERAATKSTRVATIRKVAAAPHASIGAVRLSHARRQQGILLPYGDQSRARVRLTG